ncbi:universal stress protein [Actinopolymorpha sp. B17G11]|uniref:universal stress protein n=1 Tax=Actinopolymorpha sp. B17G11 TaxID=3160861 RepID=UPI0032E4921D
MTSERTNRIVVGLDGSANSLAAARWARNEALLRGADVEAVTVWDRSRPRHLPDRPRHMTEREIVDACERMQQQQLADLDGGEVSIVTRVAQGDPVEVLTELSQAADILVVGARGRSGVAGLLLGSTSLACFPHAACPVTVVPAHYPAHRVHAPIVVGVDGSRASRKALRVAAEEVLIRDCHLIAVHAVFVPPPYGTEIYRPADDHLVEGGRQLEEAIGPVQIDFPAVPIEHKVIAGHPAVALDEEASVADLLVIGSRGHRPLSAAILGSVSLHLLAHAQRPTMVVTDQGASA